jgi:hypothetical protein
MEALIASIKIPPTEEAVISPEERRRRVDERSAHMEASRKITENPENYVSLIKK